MKCPSCDYPYSKKIEEDEGDYIKIIYYECNDCENRYEQEIKLTIKYRIERAKERGGSIELSGGSNGIYLSYPEEFATELIKKKYQVWGFKQEFGSKMGSRQPGINPGCTQVSQEQYDNLLQQQLVSVVKFREKEMKVVFEYDPSLKIYLEKHKQKEKKEMEIVEKENIIYQNDKVKQSKFIILRIKTLLRFSIISMILFIILFTYRAGLSFNSIIIGVVVGFPLGAIVGNIYVSFKE